MNVLRFEHGETLAMLRDSVRDFATQEIAPRAAAHPARRSAMTDAATQPKAQKDSSSTMSRPRCAAGANSVTRAAATGSSPPRPNPTSTRSTTSDSKFQANAHSPVARLNSRRVHWKTALRPNRSARLPAQAPPRNIPNSPALPAKATWPAVRCHSVLRRARMNDTRPVSIESKSQPSPESRRSR